MAHTQQRSEQMTIGPVTLAFPHLFQAQSPKGTNADPKFSTGLVFGQDVYNQVLPIIQDLAARAFNAGEANQPNFDWGIHPCSNKPESYIPEKTVGMYYMNPKSGAEYPPQVVDRNHQPIVDPGQVADGAQAYVSINFYTFHTGQNKGVAVGLGHILIYGKGEALNLRGGVSVATAFANIQLPPGAPAPVAAQAPAGAPAVPQASFGVPGQDPGAFQQPAPPGPPAAPAPPPAAPQHVMTAKAGGQTYEAFIAAGWNDQQLVDNGYMQG